MDERPDGATFAVLPHPSGINRIWCRSENVKLARRRWRRLSGFELRAALVAQPWCATTRRTAAGVFGGSVVNRCRATCGKPPPSAGTSAYCRASACRARAFNPQTVFSVGLSWWEPVGLLLKPRGPSSRRASSEPETPRQLRLAQRLHVPLKIVMRVGVRSPYVEAVCSMIQIGCATVVGTCSERCTSPSLRGYGRGVRNDDVGLPRPVVCVNQNHVRWTQWFDLRWTSWVLLLRQFIVKPCGRMSGFTGGHLGPGGVDQSLGGF